MKKTFTHRLLTILSVALFCLQALAAQPSKQLPLIEQTCSGCHNQTAAMGGLNFATLPFDLNDRATRERWIRIYDRIEKREMPPKAVAFQPAQRALLMKQLAVAISDADHAQIAAHGRGPMRRLNRDEYEQNLRDVLHLPHLDIREMLPEDREDHHFNKSSETLDMSRVQLSAYLDAAEVALRQAMVKSAQPPPVTKFRTVSTGLFPGKDNLGIPQAMFFLKDSKKVEVSREKFQAATKSGDHDPTLEVAFFRSPGWPYAAYAPGFVAKFSGEYRVRLSARAILQMPGFEIKRAMVPVPMTLRSRKPTSHDIAEDVRATGGIMDIQPDGGIQETMVILEAGQTVEYGLLGLPVPQPDAIPGISASYRFPPLPEGGQQGVAFQWLEIEGPVAPPLWPPQSHRVLFDDMGVEPSSKNPKEDARRLLRRFVNLAARGPVPEDAVKKFEQLVFARLEKKEPFAEAMLAGYQAFLCSDVFLYLAEPNHAEDHFAIAARLSHFLTDTRPDATLTQLASSKQLRNASVLRRETGRLIEGDGFSRFVNGFTGYWLNLRYLRRDDADRRLYPEYRLDEYLVESMERETRTFFNAMVRENLPVSTLIDADFIFANDRLSKHYQLEPLTGSAMRKVTLAKGSPLGGLLTQAAILKVTANGSSTSPVVRGAWIMDRLMGEPPQPPPPGVPAVEPDIRGAKTIRDLLALHTKSATCAGCHAKFDPVGLALENFDVQGAWRTHYRGLEKGERVTGIDRAGYDFSYTLANTVDASGQLVDGRTFKDIRDLKALFAANPRQLARNLLQQLTVYGTGTPVRFSDRAEIEKMLDSCASNGYRVRDLMLALVQSKVFLGPAGSR